MLSHIQPDPVVWGAISATSSTVCEPSWLGVPGEHDEPGVPRVAASAQLCLVSPDVMEPGVQ